MMRIKLVLIQLVLLLVTSTQYAQTCAFPSVLTIATYEPGDCGRINDKTRSTPDIKDLVEVMDNTKAYDLGTGFIYDYNDKKYVITCEHVLFKTGKIIGYDSSYKGYKLKVVGTDMFYDLAVLEFECQQEAKNFTGISFEVEEPKNKKVLSVGYWKWNGEPSLESGKIITPQNHNDLPKEIYLKSDANTSGGYSGGPLFNEDRQVIGMNNSIHIKEKTSYALKSKIIETIVQDILEHNGTVERAFCGLEFSQPITDGDIIIDEIIDDSPAANFRELLENQSIHTINEKPVKNIYDVLMAIEKMNVKEEITFGLKNGNKVSFTTEKLNKYNLEKIAVHAISKSYKKQCTKNHKCAKVKIDQEQVIIKHDGKEDIITTAGLSEDRIYCLNSPEQLGIMIRIFGLHRYIELGKDDEHIYIKQLKFSADNNKRVLYF